MRDRNDIPIDVDTDVRRGASLIVPTAGTRSMGTDGGAWSGSPAAVDGEADGEWVAIDGPRRDRSAKRGRGGLIMFVWVGSR